MNSIGFTLPNSRPAQYRLLGNTNPLHFAGAAITPEEQLALDTLPQCQKPANLVVITDPGFDVDDETALTIAASLQKRGLVDLKAVIATTIPSQDRALLAKGVLTELGLNHVPVAVGANHAPAQFSPEPQRLQASFVAKSENISPDSQATFKKALEAASDKSISLLVIANMSDAATFLRGNEALFLQKVKEVVVMGGVKQNSENDDTDLTGVKLNANGLMDANNIATNNRHNQEAADFLYSKVQEMGIPLKVVTRKAATNTPVSPEFFKDLAETGHKVAQHIRSIEGDFLNKFWQAAYNQKMGPGRDKAWFIANMCQPNTPASLSDQDDIRPHLKSRVLYDAIALLACVDGLASQLFQPLLVTTNNVTHQIIGLSQKTTGLADPQKLSTLLSALAKDALKSE